MRGERFQLPDVVGPADQVRVAVRLTQHQVLHQKLDVGDAPWILLDVQQVDCAPGELVAHPLPHVRDLGGELVPTHIGGESPDAELLEGGLDAAVAGDSIGGTGEGFIYTDSKQYDLAGTFVPMFGINNALGKLLGGGDNGMWGITFAVRGPLDKPDFKVNPLSLLAPGAFRSIFEYRAKEAPRVD